MKSSILGALIALAAVLAIILYLPGCAKLPVKVQPPSCTARTVYDHETGKYLVIWKCNDDTPETVFDFPAS